MPLSTSLATLESSGLIRLAQIEPELEYLFRHALVQDAAYESMLKADRKRLHQVIGETLERLYPERLDELASALGHHYCEAGEVDRARDYFLRAAEFARQNYANAEAIAAYTQALALTTDKAERFHLLAARATLNDVISNREKQREDIEEMGTIAERLDDDGLRFKSLLAFVDYLITTEPVKALPEANKALEITQKVGDLHFEARAKYRQGLAHLALQQFSQSLGLLENALNLYQQIDEKQEIIDCYSAYSIALMQMWKMAGSRIAAQKAVELSQQFGSLRQQALSLRRLAAIYEDEEFYQEALPYAEGSLNAYRQLGDLSGEFFALVGKGYIEIGLLNWQLAELNFKQALTIAKKKTI